MYTIPILIFKEHERANGTVLLQLTLRVVYSIHSQWSVIYNVVGDVAGAER